MQGSSSRRSVVSGMAAIALGAVGVWGWRRYAGREPVDRSNSAGPRLAYRTTASVHDARRDDPGKSPAGDTGDAVWLALAALPLAECVELCQTLRALVEALEASSTPGLVDLTSEEVTSELRRDRAWLLPVLNGAQELLAKSWLGAGLEVRVATEPANPGERVVAAWSSDVVDPLAERARFAAWPVSRAIRLGTGGSGGRDRVAAKLRGSVPSSWSPIALVVDADLCARRSEPGELGDLVRLCRARRRLLSAAAAKEPLAASLASLGTEPGGPLLPWLSLAGGDLLIVPRLGALARPEELIRAVQSALSLAKVEARSWAGPTRSLGSR